MSEKKGNLSINSENMFPIIKKWLYSDHDIFLRELVSNGCDAITKLKKLDVMGEFSLPEGYQARIDVVLDPEEKTIQVTDNGIGIPEEDIPRLFERFYRVDKARSRESGGTGLGLSIALEILNLHQGRITVDSKLGQGTSVTITLPAAGKGAKDAPTG